MDINDDKYNDEWREALKDYFDAYNQETRIVARKKLDRVMDKMAANDPERFEEWIKKRKLNPPSESEEDNEFEETEQYKRISGIVMVVVYVIFFLGFISLFIFL